MDGASVTFATVCRVSGQCTTGNDQFAVLCCDGRTARVTATSSISGERTVGDSQAACRLRANAGTLESIIAEQVTVAGRATIFQCHSADADGGGRFGDVEKA